MRKEWCVWLVRASRKITPVCTYWCGRSFSLYHAKHKVLKCLLGLSVKWCMHHGLVFAKIFSLFYHGKKAPAGQLTWKIDKIRPLKKLNIILPKLGMGMKHYMKHWKNQAFEETEHHSSKAFLLGFGNPLVFRGGLLHESCSLGWHLPFARQKWFRVGSHCGARNGSSLLSICRDLCEDGLVNGVSWFP